MSKTHLLNRINKEINQYCWVQIKSLEMNCTVRCSNDGIRIMRHFMDDIIIDSKKFQAKKEHDTKQAS